MNPSTYSLAAASAVASLLVVTVATTLPLAVVAQDTPAEEEAIEAQIERWIERPEQHPDRYRDDVREGHCTVAVNIGGALRYTDLAFRKPRVVFRGGRENRVGVLVYLDLEQAARTSRADQLKLEVRQVKSAN